jgi:PEGA domain
VPFREAPRGIAGSRVVAGPAYRSYYRPYYSFRPRVSLGFGLWVGYPVTYPYYAYPYPSDPYAYDPYYGAPAPAYGYPAAPAYGYPAAPTNGYPAAPANPAYGSVGVQPGAPGSTSDGGLSFDLTPTSAEVFVDGTYVGVVATFSPNSQPLTLAAGRHHVELRAQGYEMTVFDVDVVAGQVIPYQGSLQLLRQ